jgi:hypothetical protein
MENARLIQNDGDLNGDGNGFGTIPEKPAEV